MPWKVEKRGDKYVVVKIGTGEVKGRHPSKRSAAKQLRALYASEGKKR